MSHCRRRCSRNITAVPNPLRAATSSTGNSVVSSRCFALFTRAARQPWYWYLSPARKAEFDAAWGPIVDWHRATIDWFAAGNSANTHLLPGAPHYVYINNEAEVVRWMRAFLGIPPRS